MDNGIRQSHAVLDLPVRAGDKVLDVLGGIRAALGKRPHLRGDGRKAPPGFARARCFNSGV